LWTFVATVWSGSDLVFYYIHTSLDVFAWAQCDKRGCDVVSLFSLLLALLVPRKEFPIFEPGLIDKKNNGIPKKHLKTSGSACRLMGVVVPG
jgi:hypothetical protein